MLSQAEKLRAHVAAVPDSNGSISRAREHQALIKLGVVHRHDFSHVRLDAHCGGLLPKIPDLEFLVITDGGKLILIMVVPADVLDDLRMRVLYLEEGIDLL